MWSQSGERVGEVSAVRHSGATEAPRVPETPKADPVVKVMEASYYGWELEGSPTASGGAFNPTALTAAHKSLPLGTELKVSYRGESVKVTVNDRGPYVAGRDIDLSLAAAREIGLTAPGSAEVRVTAL